MGPSPIYILCSVQMSVTFPAAIRLPAPPNPAPPTRLSSWRAVILNYSSVNSWDPTQGSVPRRLSGNTYKINELMSKLGGAIWSCTCKRSTLLQALLVSRICMKLGGLVVQQPPSYVLFNIPCSGMLHYCASFDNYIHAFFSWISLGAQQCRVFYLRLTKPCP